VFHCAIKRRIEGGRAKEAGGNWPVAAALM
jgi:hypothetical protein